jgi:ribonuclease G
MADAWLEQRRIGETLRLLADGDSLLEIHLQRDADPLPLGWTGEAIVRERIGARQQVEASQQMAWLIGSPALPLGTRLTVTVSCESVAEPGRIKPAHVTALRAPVLPPAPVPVRPVADVPEPLQLEAWLDRAVSGHIPFAGGALSLERTRAGLVIDVDGTGETEAINEAAAQAIGKVLRLFQVGGMVLIDFISLDSKAARRRIDDALETALVTDPRPAERTAMNGFGLVQIVRPKHGPSLIDRLRGARHQGLSLESDAHALLWSAARSQGAGVRTLTARPAHIDFIEAAPALITQLRLRLGSDVQLVRDASVMAGHVHVRPL